MPRGTGFDLYYHIEGDGTANNPAVLTFTFLQTDLLSLEEMRVLLPSSVTLETSSCGIGFTMMGVDPNMTRFDLGNALHALATSKYWVIKHQA
jgi:hypothetical protein